MRTIRGIAALLAIISSGAFAERRDPPNEASTAQIAKVLREAQLIGIACGDDVNEQTCTFFANALRTRLKVQHVKVAQLYVPEELVQSFYVRPWLLPVGVTAVTVRLIEAQSGPKGAVQVFLGGTCFDPDSKQYQDHMGGFTLPIWVQTESARDTGPLEEDKASAASKLAQEFSAYWIDTVKVTTKD